VLNSSVVEPNKTKQDGCIFFGILLVLEVMINVPHSTEKLLDYTSSEHYTEW
jgi:hypothetical protein